MRNTASAEKLMRRSQTEKCHASAMNRPLWMDSPYRGRYLFPYNVHNVHKFTEPTNFGLIKP
jgi:hypothetical protein